MDGHDSDQVRVEELGELARRLVVDQTDIGVAVPKLQHLAEGRGDLLAAAAHELISGYLDDPIPTDPGGMFGASLLIAAGADPHHVAPVIHEFRDRLSD